MTDKLFLEALRELPNNGTYSFANHDGVWGTLFVSPSNRGIPQRIYIDEWPKYRSILMAKGYKATFDFCETRESWA